MRGTCYPAEKHVRLLISCLGFLRPAQSEIPLPSPPLLAKYVSPTVCIADLEVYSFLSLNEATLSPVLPVTQVAPEDQSFVAKPVIAVVQQDEFLVSSCNGTGAIGVFLNSEGDPVRGTIDWESAPRSVGESGSLCRQLSRCWLIEISLKPFIHPTSSPFSGIRRYRSIPCSIFRLSKRSPCRLGRMRAR